MRPALPLLLLAALSFSTTASAAPLGASKLELLPSSALSLTPPALDLLGTAEAQTTARTTVFGLPLNEGPIDRVVRGVIAATLVGIGTYRLANHSPSPGWSYAFLGIALIPTLTAITGYCPLYQLFGVNYTG
jgi:hypothetical protein